MAGTFAHRRLCLVCRAGDQAADRFFFWFAAESHQVPETLRRLRASVGFCPSHSRQLLEVAAEPVLTSVALELVDAARRRLRASDATAGPCPACSTTALAVAVATRELLGGLVEGRAAVPPPEGPCLGHAVEAIRAAAPPHDRRLAAGLRELFAAGAAACWLAVLAGSDRAGPTRRLLRGRLPPQPVKVEPPARQWRATLDWLCALLEVEGCPACLSGAMQERRYLWWLAERDVAHEQGDPELCPDHLHDLAAAPEVGGALVTRAAARRSAELAQVGATLTALPPAGLAGRVRTLPSTLLAGWRGSAGLRLTSRLKAAGGGVLRSYRRGRRAALGPLERSGSCAACRAWRIGARRTADLVLAAVADERTAEVYAAAHGLCVRHMPGLADAGGLPGRVLEARLAVVGWELAEADRKRSWSARHEPQATEAGAWLRASALLDGQVFGGGPATASRRRRAGPVWSQGAQQPAGRGDRGRTAPERAGVCSAR